MAQNGPELILNDSGFYTVATQKHFNDMSHSELRDMYQYILGRKEELSRADLNNTAGADNQLNAYEAELKMIKKRMGELKNGSSTQRGTASPNENNINKPPSNPPKTSSSTSTESQSPQDSFQTKPNISETKVDSTQKDYHQQSESYNTQTTDKPPTEPKSAPSEPKPKVLNGPDGSGTKPPDTVKASNFLKANRGRILAGAVGLGVAKAVVDKEDDDLLSAAGKGIKYGAIIGGSSIALEDILKTETVQDFVKGEVSSISDSVLETADAERKAKARAGKLGTAAKIGLAAAGIATIVDVAQRYGDHREAERMKREQEYKLEQKEKRKKQKNKEQSYGYVDTGQIVMELFESRTGHHKMGNAKFN